MQLKPLHTSRGLSYALASSEAPERWTRVISVQVLINEWQTSTRRFFGEIPGAGTSRMATRPFRSSSCFIGVVQEPSSVERRNRCPKNVEFKTRSDRHSALRKL